MYCITIPVFGTGRQGIAVHFPNVKMAIQWCQSTHSGPHGPNRASFFMNPMYSIARTQQCPRKSCSPRQPMAAYMWNGLQPVTSFTLIPNPTRYTLYLTLREKKTKKKTNPTRTCRLGHGDEQNANAPTLIEGRTANRFGGIQN